uniref:Uncharacterized protein, isoform B n=1 Tax=Drosophila pseudoobscura pseudoobscura TaxID=46245 RepID=A0A0R3NX15_DROPS
MTTRLAPQRQFIISTRSAVASASASAVVVDAIQAEPAEELQQLPDDVLTVEVENTNSNNNLPTAATSVTTSPTHAEQFEFCTEDGVVVSGTLEDVMTQNCQLLQKKLSEGDDSVTGTATGAEQLEVIRVVLPMDASDSSNEAHMPIHGHVVNSSSDIGGTITTTEPNGSTITHSIPIHSMADLSAIKNGVDLAQQVANGQVTVVQATEDDDGTPFITVTDFARILYGLWLTIQTVAFVTWLKSIY